MFDNILRESWAYQEILQEGLQEGRQEGLQEGQQKAYKQNIVDYLRVRFPALIPFARERLATLHDPGALQVLSLRLFAATTEDDARDCLQQGTSDLTEH